MLVNWNSVGNCLTKYRYGLREIILIVATKRNLYLTKTGSLEPLRLIYVGEAGISASEPATIVVGIVADADSQLPPARQAIAAAFDQFVPGPRRKGFIFDADEVFSDGREVEGWPKADRISLISALVTIPLSLGMAVAICSIRRNAPGRWPTIAGVGVENFQRALALRICMQSSEQFFQTNAITGEIAAIVAEDTPEMHRVLRIVRMAMGGTGHPNDLTAVNTDMLSQKELSEIGSLRWNANLAVGMLPKIDELQLADRNFDPFLQVSDACAFAFRRFLVPEAYGAQLVKSMLGIKLNLQAWTMGIASNCWYRPPAS